MAGHKKNKVQPLNQIVSTYDFSAFGKMGGRPRKFNSPEEFEEAISKYFGSITSTREHPAGLTNNNGETLLITEFVEPPTIASMCNYLDISKDTWNEYSKKEGFSETATRARQVIEAYLEQQLLTSKNTQGIIFNLKNNFGWADKVDVNQNLKAAVSTVESFLNSDNRGPSM